MKNFVALLACGIGLAAQLYTKKRPDLLFCREVRVKLDWSEIGASFLRSLVTLFILWGFGGVASMVPAAN